ncbi:MAG: ATP-binding protein [Halobacteriota archaeon]
MESQQQNMPIGKTSSPFRQPNTTYEFHFWIKPDFTLNPLDFVVAEQVDGSRTLGQVLEIYAYTDADSHMTNYIGNEFGDPDMETYSERVSTMVARAKVVRNLRTDNKEELYMPIPTDQRAYFVTADDVEAALEFDKKTGIPAGVIEQSNGLKVPVYLPPEYIVGPESAHVNVTGISGLATKTSYLMFLISAIYQEVEDISVLIFNVKHSDLLHIHETNASLSDRDKAIYELFGLEPDPFKDVSYYLPLGKDGKPDSNTPPDPNTLYAYTFTNVHDRIDLLFADIDDSSHTMASFTQYCADPDNWDTGNEGIKFEYKVGSTENKETVKTWSDLLALEEGTIGQAVYNRKDHATPPRLKRELYRLTRHSIFCDGLADNVVNLRDAVISDIKQSGKVCVVDIFNLKPFTQAFVIGDLMRKIDEQYQELDGGMPPHLVILIDELNKFAPARAIDEAMDPVTAKINYIAGQGRSLGTALFAAQQFKSQVHRQAWENCALHVIGRTTTAELRTPAYGQLDESTKNVVTSLKKGEMLLSFGNWSSPIKVRFPRPPYLHSHDKA